MPIPVHDSVIKKKNLKIHKNDTLDERQEKGFLQKELQWCRDNHDLIVRRAQKVYSFVVDMPEKDKSLTHRCCDFKKLESVLKKRLSKSVEQNKVTQTKSTSNEKPQYTFAGIRHAKMEKDARKAAQPPVKPVPGISKPKRDGIDD